MVEKMVPEATAGVDVGVFGNWKGTVLWGFLQTLLELEIDPRTAWSAVSKYF